MRRRTSCRAASPSRSSAASGRTPTSSRTPRSPSPALPFPCVALFFETPLTLKAAHRKALPAADTHELLGALRARGGTITGVTLVAGPDELALPNVVWLLTTSDGDLTAVPGRRSPQLAAMLDNIAAYLSWGAWEPLSEEGLPPERPDTPQPATAAAHTGAGGGQRWAYPRPPVRVISTAPHPTSGTGARTGRTVEPHTRRGHWRRARVGSRDDRSYEVRWIAPTRVGEFGAEEGRPGVYLLPTEP